MDGNGKCPACNQRLYEYQWGDRECDVDTLCSDDDCPFNDDMKKLAEQRYQDYLDDTYPDGQGGREYW